MLESNFYSCYQPRFFFWLSIEAEAFTYTIVVASYTTVASVVMLLQENQTK